MEKQTLKLYRELVDLKHQAAWYYRGNVGERWVAGVVVFWVNAAHGVISDMIYNRQYKDYELAVAFAGYARENMARLQG